MSNASAPRQLLQQWLARQLPEAASAWLAEQYRKELSDLENHVILTARSGEPVLLKNLATIQFNATSIPAICAYRMV